MTPMELAAPSDLTGGVLAAIALLVSVINGLLMLKGREKAKPAESHHPTAVWRRLDELAQQHTALRVEAAKTYVTREDMESMEAMVRDIDNRSRRVEVILQTVFADALRAKGLDSLAGTYRPPT